MDFAKNKQSEHCPSPPQLNGSNSLDVTTGTLEVYSNTYEVTRNEAAVFSSANPCGQLSSNYKALASALTPNQGQLLQRSMESIQVAKALKEQVKDMTMDHAVQVVVQAMSDESETLRTQAKLLYKTIIHGETERNEERRHREKLEFKKEDDEWRDKLKEKYEWALQRTSSTSCCWAILVTFRIIAHAIHDLIISLYNNPVTFMNSIVCPATESDTEQGFEATLQDDTTDALTWTEWFSSAARYSTASIIAPYIWMESFYTWAGEASRCYRAYGFWLFILACAIVAIVHLNKIPFVGKWVNPLVTMLAIAVMAKNVLCQIVGLSSLYAVACFVGFTRYHRHAKSIFTRRDRAPQISEVHAYCDYFVEMGDGLLLAQLVVGLCIAGQLLWLLFFASMS